MNGYRNAAYDLFMLLVDFGTDYVVYNNLHIFFCVYVAWWNNCWDSNMQSQP